MKRLLAAALLLASSAAAFAQVPSYMSYQGRVSDSSGTLLGGSSPVNRTVTFKFYSSSTGGTPLYAEAQTVTISAGEFSVLLGNGTGVSGLKGPGAPATTPYITIPSIATGPLYLGITVDDGTAAADAEITPRQQIVSAAYAFRAKYAEGLVDNSLSTAMLQSSSVTTTKILDANITTSKIADANIVTAKLADGSVTNAKLADGSVTAGKLADGSVGSSKIADGSIANADLADSIVNSAKITDGDVRSVDIADGSVATADLADNSVTNAKVASNAIDYAKLAAAVQQALCPAGTILPYAGDTAPSGWLLCDGTSISRTTYSVLYGVVGNRFGSADGSTFRVPDFRGRFLRGRDGGVGRDDDRNSRYAMNGGGATGDAVGSVQDEQFRSHRHSIPTDTRGSNADNLTLTGTSGSDENFSYDPGSGYEGGNETRPDNANVNYIIKY